MDIAAQLTLAGLCLGIAMSGLLTVVLRQRHLRALLSLGFVYLAFIAMIALPLVRTFAEGAVTNYMPLLLVMLLALPPAFYHYVVVKTAPALPSDIPWRDLALPFAGGVVCVGYWILPAQAKETMFLLGELPAGAMASGLALSTFVLIVLWLPVSFGYVFAILRRLTAYRAHIRQLYSDAEERDLRWVDVMMTLIILIWVTGAGSLADENFSDGRLFVAEFFLVLIAASQLVLNMFAPVKPMDPRTPEHEAEPDIKYARSALTGDHAAKLAARIDAAMQKDALYLDPSLSLQKLSQHVGALPNQVSQTLNQEIGASFFDYVAQCRIEASKPLIAAGAASVLDVALEVGFNSRSTFYKAFNRETGMTPKDYRLLHQKAA